MHLVTRQPKYFSTHLSIRYWLISFCVSLVLSLLQQTAVAQSFPANFTQVAIASIARPTVIGSPSDGRIFVAQQDGNLRVIKNGNLLPTPFIQLNVDSNGERGLLGIAFDPAFTTNQYIYLYYTVPTSGTTTVHNRISRFTANGDVVLAGSETVVLELDPLSDATNHNGGAIAFGSDQKLYVGVGENANPPNSQNLDNYLGKVLRINSDGSVPSGNPFPMGSEAKKRIWAYGLRNPYTIAFQPGTGRLFINDVGEASWEEINDATTGGLNFGWPAAEGVSSDPAFTNPVYTYPHSGPDIGCAITGGTFYSPTTNRYPDSYIGQYFFLDYCIKWIRTLDLSEPTVVSSLFATDVAPPTILGLTVGHDGYLYYLSYNTSTLYKIIYMGKNCQTVQNGSWHDSATWSCGRVPTVIDQATIRHSINIGTSLVGLAQQVHYQTGGQIIVLGSGQLQVGL